MIIIKRFSNIINTNAPSIGFRRNRKYDMDLNRLGRMKTSQRELHKTDDIRAELREMQSELNRGLGWNNLKDD